MSPKRPGSSSIACATNYLFVSEDGPSRDERDVQIDGWVAVTDGPEVALEGAVIRHVETDLQKSGLNIV